MQGDHRIRLIEELSNAYGISGFEDEVVEVVRRHSFGMSFETDRIKNCYVNLDDSDQDLPTIMLDGHSDEVGFMVRYIEDNGLIGFLPVGGWLSNNLPSSLVMVRGGDGYHKGVIVNKPIHFTGKAEKGKAPDIEELRIDMGCYTGDQVRDLLGIRVGAPIVPYSVFEYREDMGVMMGKAFDDRLGCAAALEVLRRLREKGASKNVVATITTQEEVGGRGAKIAARKVAPKFAIVFEGSPADDCFVEPDKQQCKVNGGPMIRHMDGSYISDEYLLRVAEEVAEIEDIQVQFSVRKGSGTNAGLIHVENEGIPCLVLSVPSRYIHSHHQFASIEDFESTVRLAVGVVERLRAE